MQEYALLIVGILLIASGVILASLGRPGPNPVLFLLFGVIICLVPKAASLGIKLPFGIETTVTAQSPEKQVPDTTTAVAAQIAPMQSNIQRLLDSVARQEEFNKTILSSLSKVTTNAAGNHTTPPQPNIAVPTNPDFTNNNQYTVFVFYKASRADNSKGLLQALIAAGFQASAIGTTFEEAPQLGPDGSTWIQPTERGTKITDQMKSIANSQNLPNVMIGGPYPLKRGDVQVFLY